MYVCQCRNFLCLLQLKQSFFQTTFGSMLKCKARMSFRGSIDSTSGQTTPLKKNNPSVNILYRMSTLLQSLLKSCKSCIHCIYVLYKTFFDNSISLSCFFFIYMYLELKEEGFDCI